MKDTDECYCPNCKDTRMEWARASDIDTGDVLITCSVDYCPSCLYIAWSDVKLSK